VMAHDNDGSVPVGRKPVSRSESNRRTEQYLAQVVDGSIPLDQSSADVIRDYLDAHHARQ
jgi:hypothetical protein